ncbi:TetR/AcrR family transcriptional regulator [Bradyrhizobium sp. Pa8]|uniref:TetR/AcrR family transcriptional regulator n=1 Tax=Bradyrhizobium sp. Pa8 TaxID=3386552 RepID=UPI00403FBDE2
MVSHKASVSAVGAEPVRRNGRERFAAILDAAVALFGTRGFGATTMSDIASQSHTAAGSLYRFFPTKEVVGDAVVVRYADRFETRFASLAETAHELSPAGLARAVADLMVELEDDHAAAISVADGGGITTIQQQTQTRRVMNVIARMIGRAFPSLASSEIPIRAFTVMQILKTFTLVSRSPLPEATDAVPQIRLVIEQYFCGLGEGHVRSGGNRSVNLIRPPSLPRNRPRTS